MHQPDEDDAGFAALLAALAAVDHTPGDIRRLILTHVHIDHYGLAGRLRAEAGCEVIFHSGSNDDLEVLRDPASVTSRLRKTFSEHGVLAGDLDDLTRYEDWRGFVSSVITADTELKGEETFQIGGRTWSVVYTPGHARGHICLFAPTESLLISGDHLLPSITPHIDFRRGEGDPLGDFLDSLKRVEALAPKIVLPGHGHPFEDGAERARVTARHHDRRLGSILQVIRREACSASQITDEIFSGELFDFQRRLALGEALAHIHYLRLRGEIERFEGEDGTFRYRKATRQPTPEDDG